MARTTRCKPSRHGCRGGDDETHHTQHQAQGKILAHREAFSVDFTTIYLRKINQRLPVSGGRICWAVVGRKHVRICLPVCNTRFRMTRDQWDRSPVRAIA